jgi:hypothetical protein
VYKTPEILVDLTYVLTLLVDELDGTNSNPEDELYRLADEYHWEVDPAMTNSYLEDMLYDAGLFRCSECGWWWHTENEDDEYEGLCLECGDDRREQDAEESEEAEEES